MSDSTQTEAKTRGDRFNTGKLEMFSLIPPVPQFLLARLYGTGAITKKYGKRNWELGVSWSDVYDAIQRHLSRMWAGEWFDDEMGVPHVICAAWGCFTLCEYFYTHPELDDRSKLSAKAAQLANELFKIYTKPQEGINGK